MCIEISFSIPSGYPVSPFGVLQGISEEEQARIEELFASCCRKEPISLSPLIPCEKEDLSVFFYWQAGRLISVLEAAPFSPGVWELRAFTRPENRRKGCVRRLFRFMTERLFPDEFPEYKLPEFFFYDDGNSEDTAGFIRHASCQKLDTDHLLSLKVPWPDLKKEGGTRPGRVSVPTPVPKFSAVPHASLNRLVSVHKEVFHWPALESREYLAECLKGPDCLAFLILEKNRPAGCFLLTNTLNETVCLSAFGLTPTYRGKGISFLALQTVLDSLPADCKKLNVQVSESNQPAYRLYRKAGFVSASRLSSYRFSGFFS